MQKKTFLILITILVGMCSIIYELLISTTSSYFLGNSVKQFSLIIGFYMAFMGLGAYFSKLIKDRLIYNFVLIEILLGLIGAFSVPLCYLYILFADFEGFNIFVFLLISVIGILTGLEVPLLTRILEHDYNLKDNISNILSFDYLGALIATIAFPFFLLPFVGVFKSSLFFGLLNIMAGLVTFLFFRKEITLSRHKKNLMGIAIASIVGIILFSVGATKSFMSRWHNGIFKHPVIYSEQSPYQDITVTKTDSEFRLYLNGAIQFSSRDEYRYHEALVHIAMMQHPNPKNILLLGGGEGLAAREIYKYPIAKLDLVDIDPAITELSTKMSIIKDLNEGTLEKGETSIYHEDAFTYLLNSKQSYDVIICDLPDPNSENIAKLYSRAFYQLVKSRLSKDGLMVTQGTSPTLTPNAFWCIEKTIADSGFDFQYPYQVNVPSFGNWGFILGSPKQILFTYDESIPTSFFEPQMLNHIFYFPKDNRAKGIAPNYLDQPILMEYYLEHWRRLNHEER